ncbi:MAG: hypothetical protein OJF51_002359 [Nitrospira sp.]|jgi:hypothetical protein|nr:MAG: hypothetical protein OJF51_002359 [Nitrospira sp.]
MTRTWSWRLSVFITGVFVFLFFFSTKKTSYQCDGQFEGKEIKEIVYFKLTENRWWVLWADNDGLFDIEVPSRASHGGLFVFKRIGDQIQLFSFENRLKGTFSFLSNHAVFWLDSDYQGACRRID